MKTTRRQETRLADLRDLAETREELRAAHKYALELLATEREPGGCFLAAMTYRTVADDLQRRQAVLTRQTRQANLKGN